MCIWEQNPSTDALILTGPLIPLLSSQSSLSFSFSSHPVFCPGFTPSALALWDVDGDSVEDAIVGVAEGTDDTHPTRGDKSARDQISRARGVRSNPAVGADSSPCRLPVYSVAALSAVGGRVLWRKVLAAPVMYIQCGLQYPGQPSPVVVLISRAVIAAVNGTTGETAEALLAAACASHAS